MRSSAPRTDICFDEIQEPVEGDAVVTDVLRSENEIPLFRIPPPKQEPAGRMCDTPTGVRRIGERDGVLRRGVDTLPL